MLDYSKAKKGSFTQEERETIVITNKEGADITTSETKMITKLTKLYSSEVDIQVVYYEISSTTGDKYPTEIRLQLPTNKFVTFRGWDSVMGDKPKRTPGWLKQKE